MASRGPGKRSVSGRLLDLYAVAILLWIGIWRVAGDASGWLALLNAWAFWLLATGLPAGVASLAPRAPWLGLGWAAGLVLLLRRRYGWLLRRPSSRATPAGPNDTLTLVSANLLNQERNLASTGATLLAQGADLLLVQEAIPEHVRQLECLLAGHYPHRIWVPYRATNMGLGIASRFPCALTGLWQDVGLEPYALRLTVALCGGPLDVYCVHFISPLHQVRRLGLTRLLRARQQQVQTILAAVADRDVPAVLAGDWNSTEGTDVYRWATGALTDAWIEAGTGPGWSWPVPRRRITIRFRPLLRLDYLLHTGCRRTRPVTAASMRLLCTDSDHCGLVGRLHIGRADDCGRADRPKEVIP